MEVGEQDEVGCMAWDGETSDNYLSEKVTQTRRLNEARKWLDDMRSAVYTWRVPLLSDMNRLEQILNGEGEE